MDNCESMFEKLILNEILHIKNTCINVHVHLYVCTHPYAQLSIHYNLYKLRGLSLTLIPSKQ